jgi:hypothetical protein
MWYQKWCLGSAVIRDTRVLSDKPESRSHMNYLKELARKDAAPEATTESGEGESGLSGNEEVDAIEETEEIEEIEKIEEIEEIEVEDLEVGQKSGKDEGSKRDEDRDGAAEIQVSGEQGRGESRKGKGANKGDGTGAQPSALADGLALPLADAISKVVS